MMELMPSAVKSPGSKEEAVGNGRIPEGDLSQFGDDGLSGGYSCRWPLPV